ncbi:hypothetical protein LTR78_004409 [Recurvomyces mirabilis]|uniref:Uncharacterized protein n=1 Tax=Recurvomyces mirabilis TaxID=574656 RepID=A0AAE0WPW9_9PEZI|nr:hypothetical protein LTR78_004409 [Recurvomyces mirabilis]KAK5155925.1 hypothetical protein LTS14_005491 [Recurvomyces mirabilis]
MERDPKDTEEGNTAHHDDYATNGQINGNAGPDALRRMMTSGTMPPDVFERLYLQPQTSVAGDLRKRFGNPTPIALLGFSVGLTPLSIALMGWRGSGGNAVATTGATLWFGGMLLIIAGVGEWILGNNFPCYVFFGYGCHFLTFGVTFIPYYNAVDAYTATGGGGEAQFYASYGVYYGARQHARERLVD